MNELQNTMFRLATIADELEQSGFHEDAEHITQLMESITADVLRGNMREAQFDFAGAGQQPAPQFGQSASPFTPPAGNMFDQMIGQGQQAKPVQPVQAAQPTQTMDQKIKQALNSVGGMTNDQQVLAWQYVKWAEAQPAGTPILSTIYKHALEHQSPQYTNKLIAFLKAYGFQQ